jgi:hypothetical protein
VCKIERKGCAGLHAHLEKTVGFSGGRVSLFHAGKGIYTKLTKGCIIIVRVYKDERFLRKWLPMA